MRPVSAAPTADFGTEAWKGYHARNLRLTIPLPEGRGWVAAEKAPNELVVTHDASRSVLRITALHETELMSRQRCEDRARARGLVPNVALRTIDEEVLASPEGYDGRLWVAAESVRTDGSLVGHAFLFTGALRECFVVHLSTEVPTKDDEPVLSSRLATVRAKLFARLKADPPRTQGDVEVPREKPGPSRPSR